MAITYLCYDNDSTFLPSTDYELPFSIYDACFAGDMKEKWHAVPDVEFVGHCIVNLSERLC